MEICQFCGMYMKPFFVKDTDGNRCECEFCGRMIAKVMDKKWVKIKEDGTIPVPLIK